jgi:hypothetical protein
MKKITYVLLGIGAIVAISILSAPKTKIASHENNPCPDANPCIQVTQSDGTRYRLNDFRFVTGHCLLFVSLPYHGHHETCGNYKLDWIGADNSEQKHGTSISN